MMPAVLGDFLTAAGEHLDAAVVVGDGQLDQLPEVVRDLHRLVVVISHYCDDLAPCDEVEAANRNDLHTWERAVIDADVAVRAAVGCLHRGAAELASESSSASWRARHLAAGAANLAAGRDLLHTHRVLDPDGLMRDRSEWAPVITSLPATRALANELSRWSWQLAPFTAWLAGSAMSSALPHTQDQALSAAVCDHLVSASQWLQVAGATACVAASTDPVQPTDIELLRAIPAANVPERLCPDPAEESVAELCDGIAVSASRLRAATRASRELASWSPSLTSGGWQWMAQGAAVTSHLGELALRSLVIRAGQLTDPPITAAELDQAAERLVDMRAAWQRVGQVWDGIITESRLVQSPAMTDASDLVLRMGRLVWDNPRWTPARSDRAPQRTPAALAPTPAAVTSIVTAAHHAVDALARVAMTDIEAIKEADRAGRLHVPTRSLPDDENVPRPFAPAPAARFRALHNAYRTTLEASVQTAEVLDQLVIAARSSSMPLALARAAASVQSNRLPQRLSVVINDALYIHPTPFMNSRGYTGRAGPLEQAMINSRVSDPTVLLRASAIDNAARHLIAQAESIPPESGETDGDETRHLAAHYAAELASRSFPRGPHAGLAAQVHGTRPDNPMAPVTGPRTGPAGRGSARQTRRARPD